MTIEPIPLFKLSNLREGTFIDRPNRFVSNIKYNNKVYNAHVHDPGRLTELLVEGARVLFTESRGKLDFYIRAVKANNEWVLIDTAQHSKIALELFKKLPDYANVKEIRKEVQIGRSRIDFTVDGVPLEVKGVTLVKGDVALFPDAPTERGTRHVQEIIDYKGIILFLIFRDAKLFGPNQDTDPKFAQKLSEARKKKSLIITAKISFDGEMLYYEGKIPLFDF
jgi:sugar fermentation stimulation protein A